jgi:hypothetical protein
MGNSLAIITTPVGVSETTGLTVYKSFTANSGFNYMVGVREVQDLLIVEQIAEGTGCTYLCGIIIYHKENRELLKEITLPNGVHYTRTKVVGMVQKSIIELLEETCKKDKIDFDREHAQRFVNEIIDNCYFEASRKSILSWARTAGIIKN